MTMQYSSRVFDPKKKTMIVSISETKKEQRKSFVRTEEICEEEREKSVHQKRDGFPEETCRQLGIQKVRGIGKVIFLNGWMRKI